MQTNHTLKNFTLKNEQTDKQGTVNRIRSLKKIQAKINQIKPKPNIQFSTNVS